jgi:hypothetical protein
MSMVGEIENLQREIARKEEELMSFFNDISLTEDISEEATIATKLNTCACEIEDLEKRLERLK